MSELNDETLNKAFTRVKSQFKDAGALKELFYSVREGITEVVRSCSDNIRCVVYIDEILDEPIVVAYGKEENRLIITICSNGKVTYKWSHETWAKFLSDVLNEVQEITKNIVRLIRDKLASLRQVQYPSRPAIGFEN